MCWQGAQATGSHTSTGAMKGEQGTGSLPLSKNRAYPSWSAVQTYTAAVGLCTLVACTLVACLKLLLTDPVTVAPYSLCQATLTTPPATLCLHADSSGWHLLQMLDAGG